MVDIIVFLAAIALTLFGGARLGWALATADRRVSQVLRDTDIDREAERDA